MEMKAEDARNISNRNHYAVKNIYRIIEVAANKGDFVVYFGLLDTVVIEIIRNDGYIVTPMQNGNTRVEWE